MCLVVHRRNRAAERRVGEREGVIIPRTGSWPYNGMEIRAGLPETRERRVMKQLKSILSELKMGNDKMLKVIN